MSSSESRARLQAALLYVVSEAGDPERQAAALCQAVDGGADVVQLRNKTAGKGTMLAAAKRVGEHARANGALFIVNDHVDLAIAAGADGVHLGQDDLPAAVARDLWPGGLVGLSTHSREQALDAEAQGADYIGVGPVHATPTKPGRPAVGLALLGQLGDLAIPWFAIGGIDAANLAAVVAAGASRVAVVRAAAIQPATAAASLRERLRAELSLVTARG